MANNLKLDKTIQVNGELYDVTAVEADKLVNTLTIKKGSTILGTFDGSKNEIIEVPSGGDGGGSGNLTVTLDGTPQDDASISISKDDPQEGNPGDIWFKYDSYHKAITE